MFEKNNARIANSMLEGNWQYTVDAQRCITDLAIFFMFLVAPG
jgi:hypothetical protein